MIARLSLLCEIARSLVEQGTMPFRTVARSALLAVACATCTLAQAGPLYEWQGSCIGRQFVDEFGTVIPLPCPDIVHGFVQMYDGYVPGTSFDFFVSSLPGTSFTLFDDVAPSGAAVITPDDTPFLGILPAAEGLGSLYFHSDGGLVSIGLTGWQFVDSWRVASGHLTILTIVGGSPTFRLVSEPSSLLLYLCALGVMLTMRLTPLAFATIMLRAWRGFEERGHAPPCA